MIGIIYLGCALIIILIASTIEKSRKYINQYLSEFLATIGAIGLSLVGIMASSEEIFVGEYKWKDVWGLMLIIFIIIMFVAIYVGASRNKHNFNLNEEIKKNQKLQENIQLYNQEYYKLCSTTILFLFKDFFTTGNERISIYKHHGNHFTLLGRYSGNGNYNRRTTYEYNDNEGLIGKAWNEGEQILTGSPKWVKNGSEYKKFMKQKCSITDKRLSKIRMRSRSFFIKTLDDKNTAENPDGIIVFESMEPNKIIITECKQLLENNENSILSLLKNMKSLTNRVS